MASRPALRALAAAALLSAPPSIAATIERVSIGLAQGNGDAVYWNTLSGDGNLVLFGSEADNLVPGDGNGVVDLFLRNRAAGTTERVSVSTAGAEANGAALNGWISANGRFIGWISDATNLTAGDTNGVPDSFVRDLATGTTVRVSSNAAGEPGNATSYEVTVSADGRYAAFWSEATNLVPGDTNGVADCFVRDLQLGTVERIVSGLGGAEGNGDSYFPSITPDGRYVAFSSNSSNLVANDGNGVADVFRLDRATSQIELASRTPLGTSGNAASNADAWAIISNDGRYVAFHSLATDLLPGDTNGAYDSFVRDFALGATTRISLAGSGAEGNGESYLPSISGDGRYATFGSTASNLVSGDGNGAEDCFRFDLATGSLHCFTRTPSGAVGNGGSYGAMPSADGRHIVFMSEASDLVPTDSNGKRDAFVRTDCWVELAEYGAGKAGSGGFTPHLHGTGGSCAAGGYALQVDQVLGGTLGLLIVGTSPAAISAFGGTILVGLGAPVIFVLVPVPGPAAPGLGLVALPSVDLDPFASFTVRLQFLFADPAASFGVSMSQGLSLAAGE